MKVRWLLVGLLLVALLSPALMITVVRVMQPDEGRWIRLVSFTPYAFVLYAMALLLLLFAMAVGGGASRRVSGLVALLVVPLLALHLFWASGPYVGKVPDAEGERFTVMAANLAKGEADPARIVDIAVKNNVDVVVLSEITPTALRKLNVAGLSRDFPYAEGETAPGVGGTMVFSTDQSRQVVPLSSTFRGYAMRLSVGASHTLQLVAVHPYPPMGDAEEWRSDHEVIRDFVARNEAAADATVIAGDLNATPDHRVIGDLEDLGFRSAADTANARWQPTWPSGHAVSLLGVGIPSMLRIDHVLVTGAAAAVTSESATVQGTDHRALVATLIMR